VDRTKSEIRQIRDYKNPSQDDMEKPAGLLALNRAKPGDAKLSMLIATAMAHKKRKPKDR
jgi:hypothetical protein